MVQALTFLLAGLLLPGADSATQHPEGSAERKAEKPSKEAAQDSTGAPSRAFPWELNRTYRFTWLKERKKVGESTFKILEEPAPTGSPSKVIYRSVSQYWYKREGTTLEGSFDTRFTASWRPIRYKLRTLMSGMRNMRALQVQEGEIKDGRLNMTTVHNGDPNTEVRPAPLEAPTDAYLFLNQAFDTWAILATDLLRKPADHDAKVIYPDLNMVYDIHFKFEREEKIDLGSGEAPLCRFYSFSSKEGQFKGKLRMDGRGRLVQYQQADLILYLEG